MKHRGRG